MKLIVNNSNKIVRSAFVVANELSLSLFINVNNHAWPDMIITEKKYVDYVFYNGNENADEHDRVRLAWESEEERCMLNRIAYLSIEKDQLQYMYVANPVDDYNGSTAITSKPIGPM